MKPTEHLANAIVRMRTIVERPCCDSTDNYHLREAAKSIRAAVRASHDARWDLYRKIDAAYLKHFDLPF
jgi:hypothetical protein